MSKIFGAPILAAIVLGMMFPYAAISLIPYSVVFLIILMINAGLVIDWRQAVMVFPRWHEIGLGLILLFVIFPLILWALASVLISDQQYLYGFLFSSLCPVALVAPYFTKIHRADEQLSFLLMVSSMILCPILAPLILALVFPSPASLNLVPLARYMLLLVTVPLLLSVIISRFLPTARIRILRYDHLINMLSLALLVFTLFGTARGKLNLHYINRIDILVLLVLVFLQDFGVLFASRGLLARLLKPKSADALAISLSMKNVAIAAGVLLVYDPKASFVPALAFVAHAFLFNFLAVPKLYRTLSK